VTDPRFATSAKRVKDWYAGVDGAGRAADAIGRYLALRADTSRTALAA
jgi:hypothetical protein